MVPMAAALLTSARGAVAWSAVCLAVTLGFWLVELSAAPANPPTGTQAPTFLVLFHGIALACATTLAVVFARNHERLRRRLNDANEELQRESEFVRLVHRSTVLVHESGEVVEGLTRAVELVCRGLRWDVGVVWMRPDEQAPLAPIAEIYERDAEAAAPFRRALLAGCGTLVSRAIARRGPVGCKDVSTDPAFGLREAARAAGLRGGLAFPFLSGVEVSAVVELFSCEPRVPDRRLLRLLSHVGTQVARLAERQRAEARIENLAYYDALTGLPNRQLFQDRGQVDLGTQVALELDREAVGLVADALEEQHAPAARQELDRIRAPGLEEPLGLEAAAALHPHARAVFVALFRDAEDLDRQRSVLEGGHHDADLPPALVDHQQVRQRLGLDAT